MDINTIVGIGCLCVMAVATWFSVNSWYHHFHPVEKANQTE